MNRFVTLAKTHGTRALTIARAALSADLIKRLPRAIDPQVVGVSLLLLLFPLSLVFFGRAVWNGRFWTDLEQMSSRTHFEHLIGNFTEANRTFPDVPIIVDMTIFADVPKEEDAAYQQLVVGREAKLRSAVSDVIRSLSHHDLREPTLATLKRKVKVAMRDVTGSDTTVFDHLLIPDFDARQMN